MVSMSNVTVGRDRTATHAALLHKKILTENGRCRIGVVPGHCRTPGAGLALRPIRATAKGGGNVTSSGDTRILWLLLAATTAVQILATFASYTIAAIAPDVAAGIGVSPDLVGFQVSLLYTGATLSSTTAGFQLRRWGAVRVSQASVTFSVLGAACAIWPSLLTIGIGSLIMGIGYGMTNPAASHLLMQVAPAKQRNLIFSLKQTGVPLGGVAAGLVSPPVSQAFGWQWALALAVGVGAIIIVALQPLRRRWDADRDPVARLDRNLFDGLLIVLRSSYFRWVSANGFFYAAVQLTLGSFIVTLLVTETGMGLVAAGTVLAVVQATGVGGRVLWGWLADRYGNGPRIIVLIGAVSTAGALITTLVDASWPLIALYALFATFGTAALGWTGVMQAAVASASPPGRSGAIIGGVAAPTYAGVIVGPAVFSVAFSAIGSYAHTFAVVALFALAGMACILIATRRRMTPEQQ
jgi:MFS family permease